MARGLRGLPGLNNISEEERRAFLLTNASKLQKYEDDPELYEKAASVLYNNQAFKKEFGEEAFQQVPDYTTRNQLLREKIINSAFEREFKPVDEKGKRNNKKGLGKDWEKYAGMSTDAKEELLKSDWKTPEELEAEQKQRTGWLDKAVDFVAGEAIQQYKKDSNQKILDTIFSKAADNAGTDKAKEVSQAYSNYDITGHDDEDTKKKFVTEITPGSYDGNLGISEFASHYGSGKEGEISPEMEDFTIDEMRQILAKKAVYEATMSPEMANTALNNEAKRYIKEHQSGLRRFGLFAKDVGIAAMSYTADKVNGLYNLGLMAADKMSELPTVYVDNKGEIVDTSQNQILQRNGNLFYRDSEGKEHQVHQQQIARTTLHNLGRNEDGSKDDSLLNPQYWTRAEQFGTLDEAEQEQYEKLGSSPYKVAYDPNEDTDLVYESFKMMSFGIADAASMLLPFGVGMAGRALSTASKMGKAGRTLGKALDFTGKALGAETKFGRTAQGLAGAGGIAYAYQRGAFQETLAQNLANAEEALVDRSKKDIYDRYQQDKEYKGQVDAMIAQQAASMKAEYLAQAAQEGGAQILDEKAIDEMVRARAQDAVINNLVRNQIEVNKNSQEYADLQQKAIDEAGNAATATFLPEAVKYGLVNTVGFRKFLYSHPTSLTQKAAKNFKGIVEKETEGGAKRLAVSSKFATRGQKMKQLGKVIGGQMWGGAWTNGTDDMQVDAAERINTDKFGKYLNAYANDEAIADVYGVSDWLYSYMKGLQNSMGQETTWDAATVGGFGSVVSASPHMANIAHLASKEGREAFKNNFQQRYKRDENGFIVKGEDGKPIMEDVSWTDNWRDRAAFFIQNGILNEYYGRKQGENSLREHADYVNNLLDSYKDFEDLEKIVSADLASQNAENTKDEKTARFMKAIATMNALDHLAQNEKDPTTLSSVVQDAKNYIDRLSSMSFDPNSENALSEEEVTNILGQYYAQHPNLERTDANNQKALYEISENAQKLKEASEAYGKAEEQIRKVESTLGRPIDYTVRENLKLRQALDSHYRERIKHMQNDINDHTSIESTISEDMLIPSVGGRKIAETYIKTYDDQKEELKAELSKAKEKSASLQEALNKANDVLKNAKTSNERYEAQKKVNDAQAKLDSSKANEEYINDMMSISNNKQSQLKTTLNNMEEETPDRILTADEIFNLDPVSRARMMNPVNRNLYKKEQQREIEKLENTLRMKDESSLEKIQDIAALAQRVATNTDAYNRMAKNPEAAASALEEQRVHAADAAHKLNSRRQGEMISDLISRTADVAKQKGESKESTDGFVYSQLRMLGMEALNVIDKDNLLPDNKKQVEDAKQWRKTVEDVINVVDKSDNTKEEKDNLLSSIEEVANKSADRTELISNLEKMVDVSGDEALSKQYNNLLKGLEDLGYQRDKAVIESREERLKREQEQKQREENAKKEIERVAKEAQEKAAKEEEENKKREDEKAKDKTVTEDLTISNLEDVSLEDEGPSSEKATEETEEKPETEGFTQSVANFLMEDDAEAGSVDAGTMWSKGPDSKQGIINVNRDKNGVITFTNDGKPEILSISIEENKETENQGLDYKVNEEAVKNITLSKYKELNPGFIGDDFISKHPDRMVDEVMKKAKITAKYLNNEYNSDRDYLADMGYATGTNSWLDSPDTSKQEIQQRAQENASLYEEFILSSKDINDANRNILNVKAIEKKPDGWYFNGTFAGETTPQEVKVREGFDLNKAIEEQRVKREAEAVASGADVASNNFIIEDGNTIGVSESLDDAVKATHDEDKMTTEVSDAEDINNEGNKAIDTNSLTLSANAMSEYDAALLEEDGILERKHETRKTGERKLENYQNWMDAEGMHIQNIIDTELHKFLTKKEAKGEKLKIKFACSRPDDNRTHDNHIKSHLFLVIDYDGDISSVHKKENGGVIESNGKKYLVVGTVGYGNVDSSKVSAEQLKVNLARRDLFDIVFRGAPDRSRGLDYGLLQKGRKQYFTDHPSDRFRVLDDVTTEIVPYTLIPGYMVKQFGLDDSVQLRSISDILYSEGSEKMNPDNLEFDKLKFAIQEYSKFFSPNEPVGNVMVPRNDVANAGNTFLLIPASNGKMLPVEIHAWRYNQLRDGKLKSRVEEALEKLSYIGKANEQYVTRRNAIDTLIKIFHMKKEGNTVVLKKDGSIDFISHDSGKELKINVNPSTSTDPIQDIKDAFKRINPRVNITPSVLRDKSLLRQYDEAGALQTDCALLHTVGSRYSIYPINDKGQMVVEPSMSVTVSRANDSTYRNENKTKIDYGTTTYFYDSKSKKYTASGQREAITDEALIRDLDYNRKIIEDGLLPRMSDKTYNYFILSTGDKPKVIAQNGANHKIKELSEEESRKKIEEIETEEARQKRAEEARKALKTEDVPLDIASETEASESWSPSTQEFHVGETVSHASLLWTVEEITPDGIKIKSKTSGMTATFSSDEFSEISKVTLESQEKEKIEGKKPSPVKQQTHTREDLKQGSLEAEGSNIAKEGTVDFKGLLRTHKNQKLSIIKSISEIPGAPIKFDEHGIPEYSHKKLTEFLQSLRIPVEGIGTSDADLQAWLHTIDCRK